MVLCRSEGRLGLTLTSFFIRRVFVGLWPFFFLFFFSLRGFLARCVGELGWFQNRSLAFRSGLGLYLFGGGGHISFSILFFADLGHKVSDGSTCVGDGSDGETPVLFCFVLFFLVVFGIKSKALGAESRLDEASCDSQLLSGLPTRTQTGSIYSDSCWQMAAARPCSAGGALLCLALV